MKPYSHQIIKNLVIYSRCFFSYRWLQISFLYVEENNFFLYVEENNLEVAKFYSLRSYKFSKIQYLEYF